MLPSSPTESTTTTGAQTPERLPVAGRDRALPPQVPYLRNLCPRPRRPSGDGATSRPPTEPSPRSRTRRSSSARSDRGNALSSPIPTSFIGLACSSSARAGRQRRGAGAGLPCLPAWCVHICKTIDLFARVGCYNFIVKGPFCKTIDWSSSAT